MRINSLECKSFGVSECDTKNKKKMKSSLAAVFLLLLHHLAVVHIIQSISFASCQAPLNTPDTRLIRFFASSSSVTECNCCGGAKAAAAATDRRRRNPVAEEEAPSSSHYQVNILIHISSRCCPSPPRQPSTTPSPAIFSASSAGQINALL